MLYEITSILDGMNYQNIIIGDSRGTILVWDYISKQVVAYINNVH